MGGPKQSLKQFSEFHPFNLPYVLYRAIQQLTSKFVMTHKIKRIVLRENIVFKMFFQSSKQLFSNALKSHFKAIQEQNACESVKKP